MPTYEYKCKECEHSFEVFQSMKDEPLSVCPECGGVIRRLLSGGAGVIFKGQGFYVTDKGKSAVTGAPREGSTQDTSKKETTSTASSNTDSAAPPCSACPAASAGSCAARADNAS